MKSKWLIAGATCAMATTVGAQDLTWTKDIQPLIKAKCGMDHGASAPRYEDRNADRKNFEAKKIGPRMDNYADFMRHVVWPATGSLARQPRRWDDRRVARRATCSRSSARPKPTGRRTSRRFKAWLGDGAWNLNRWEARDNVPAVTKAQLDKVKAKY